MADRRVRSRANLSPRDGLVALITDAVAEVDAWWSTVVELGERIFAHPAANEMRFAAAMQVLSQLEQLESELDEVLVRREALLFPDGGERPPSVRRRSGGLKLEEA